MNAPEPWDESVQTSELRPKSQPARHMPAFKTATQRTQTPEPAVKPPSVPQTARVIAGVQLAAALAFARQGDVLVCTKPDRLARSTSHLLRIIDDLAAREIGLVVLSMGGERLDTRNPTSKLMLTVLAGVATWEREIMIERQREGVARAKAAGKYKGRKPTARAKADEVKKLAEGGTTREEIARQVGVSTASVYRILREARAK